MLVCLKRVFQRLQLWWAAIDRVQQRVLVQWANPHFGLARVEGVRERVREFDLAHAFKTLRQYCDVSARQEHSRDQHLLNLLPSVGLLQTLSCSNFAAAH